MLGLEQETLILKSSCAVQHLFLSEQNRPHMKMYRQSPAVVIYLYIYCLFIYLLFIYCLFIYYLFIYLFTLFISVNIFLIFSISYFFPYHFPLSVFLSACDAFCKQTQALNIDQR